MIDLNELSKKCKSINDKRMENGATVSKDLLKHCAGELIEAVQAREFYKHTEFFSSVNEQIAEDNFADELADVIVCILIESAEYNVNIENALLKCIEKNRKRADGIGDKK